MIHTKNEIKAQIIRAGYTMSSLLNELRNRFGWSGSVSNLSNKLARDSLRYHEAMEIADILGYEIVWMKRPAQNAEEESKLIGNRSDSVLENQTIVRYNGIGKSNN